MTARNGPARREAVRSLPRDEWAAPGDAPTVPL